MMKEKASIPVADSYETVLNNLSSLDAQLPSLGLDQLLVFNRTYVVITKTIQEHSDNDYFLHPSYVEQFTVAFAEYYFQIIRQIITSSTSQSAAWNKLLQARKHPHSIQLLMGANAHINHDLPLVMTTFTNQKYADDLFRDIFRIDVLLLKAGREITALFDEPYKCLNFIKKHLRFLYYIPVMWMILAWRISAWRQYKKIKKHGLNKVSYQKKSIRIANRLFAIGSLLKF